MHRLLTTLLFLVLILSLSQALTLGTRVGDEDRMEEEEAGEQIGAVERREGGRRATRDRYRMGYMFGKRSGLMQDGETNIFIKTLTGKAVSVDNLTSALQQDPQLARHVATHLDKNGDGFVSLSELL